jgi:hypothetical protein
VAPDPAPAPPAPGRDLLVAWLHLAVLWMLGFAKPLFDVLADEPEFFVARANTAGDIVIFALAAAFVPPTAMVLCEALLLRFGSARRILHLIFVGVLVAAIAVQILDDWVGGSGPILIAVALAIGAAGAVAYARTPLVPGVLTVLGPAPVVFLVIFLLLSPVSKLVLGEGEEAVAATARGSTPVVVVVFDEFSAASLADRRGRIDASRFPNLAALARDGTWYRNATTVADQTTRAVPAILTGSRPSEEELPIAADHPQNLFTLLGGHYALNVSEPATDLCPRRLCRPEESSREDRLRALVDDLSVVSQHLVLPEDLEDRLPPVDSTFGGFRRAGRDTGGGSGRVSEDIPGGALEDRVGQFDRFLRGIRAEAEKPRLDFLHIELPHVPWQYLPSGRSYLVSGPDRPGLSSEHWGADRWLVLQAYQRYLLQVGFADRLLGRLVKRLRDVGLYDRSILVVTGDHGVSFHADRSRRVAEADNLAEIANVPLLVKEPRQQDGRVNEGPARTIDILPTIADAIGLRLPERVDGQPLPGSPEREALDVASYTGKRMRLPMTEFVRRRDAEIRRRIGLFGAGEAFADIYAAGPYLGLLGAGAARLSSGARAGFRVQFDHAREYSSYDRGTRQLPIFVTGRLTGSARADVPVAIAVNGRIAAVARTYQNGTELRVGALVPPTTFRGGRNDVEAFVVTRSGAGLASAGRADQSAARLVRADGALELHPSGGEPIPVEKDAAAGFIERVRTEAGGLTVSGWATDRAHNRPADEVYVFADNRLLQSGPPGVPRLDLAKQFGPKAVLGGYEFRGLAAPAEAATPERLRVFAVADGRATELEPTGSDTFLAAGG